MDYNKWIVWLLRSPLHGLLSASTAVLTLKGRKSGKSVTVPVNFTRDGSTLWITSKPERVWWRNLEGGAPVKVLLARKEYEGRGEVFTDPIEVAERLQSMFTIKPGIARYYKVRLDANGLPIPQDCEEAAKQYLIIKIELNG